MARGRKKNRTAEARRAARKAIASGDWGEWIWSPVRIPPGKGWFSQVESTHRNGAFSVLTRKVPTPWGEVVHLAIRNFEGTDISWADKQRIKNEIAGERRTAIEVFPDEADLVDEANMYHLWILPEGFALPFSI